MTKSNVSKAMCSVDRVFAAIDELRTQHNDGLIHTGEFVRMCISKFDELALYQLNEARHTVECYGHDDASFAKFMREQHQKEGAKINGKDNDHDNI